MKNENFKVTPYEVKGSVDYNKLIEKFGTQPINQKLLDKIEKITGELHPFLEKGIYYSHRDLDKILEDYEKGIPIVLYTGRGPSDKMHLGHLIPFIFTKYLQEKLDAKVYIMLSDDEKYLFKDKLDLETVMKYREENLKDILAIGFDPEKTVILKNTEDINKIYKVALMIAKRITLSTVKATFGFKDDTNIGLPFYTAIQSAPCYLDQYEGKNVNVLVPMGIDQDPHFRLSRDIAPKLGFKKPGAIHSKFFPSLKGEGKMSSSDVNSAIFLDDSPEDVKKKVMGAFTGGGGTLEEHKKYGGNPEVCSVFKYFEFLFEDDINKLNERKEKCRNGEITCGECKKELIKRINEFLEKHRKAKEKF